MENALSIDSLISVQTFLDEIGMCRRDFKRLRDSGRVQGLITIAGRVVVNRLTVNIVFFHGGKRFKGWIDSGGRLGSVKRDNKL